MQYIFKIDILLFLLTTLLPSSSFKIALHLYRCDALESSSELTEKRRETKHYDIRRCNGKRRFASTVSTISGFVENIKSSSYCALNY